MNELLTLLLPARPSRRVLLSVLEATEGNPLFITTLARQLLAGGQLAVAGNETVSTVGDELVVPSTELGDALELRLARLGPACRELTELAAFLGDGGDLDDLTAVAGELVTDIEELLDEAEVAGVLFAEGDDRYRFAHPELRQRLYHAPSTRRRRAIHLRIADALDPPGAPNRARAMEIAHHLRRAGRDIAPERVAMYATWAGEQAFTVFAWPKAARYYESALEAVGQLEAADDALVLRLSLGAARAHFCDHNLADCVRHASRAAEVAGRAGDLDRRCSATLLLARAQLTLEPGGVATATHIESLDALLAEVGHEHPRLRARILQLLAEESFARLDFASGHAFAAEAAELGRAAADDRLTSEVEFAAGLQHLGLLDLPAARGAFERHLAAADRAGDIWIEAWGRGRLVLVDWLAGDLRRSALDAETAVELTRANRHWAEQSLVAAVAAGVALSTGDFAAVERLAAEAIVLYHRSDYAFVPMLVFPVLASARASRGDVIGAHEAIEDWERTGARGTFRMRLAVDALLGDEGAVRARLEARPFLATAHGPANLFTIGWIGSEVEIGLLGGDDALVQLAASRLTEVAATVAICVPSGSLVCRLLGLAQARAGDTVRATATLRQAIVTAESIGARPELARARLDLGDLLLNEDDAAGAQHELAGALDLADELGMLPTLRRAQGLLARLPQAPTPTIATRTLFLCDIKDSTPELFRSGDAGYIEMIRDMSRTVRARLRQYDGVEFKHTGDGIFAWFASAVSVARSALAIQADLAHRNEVMGGSPLILRIGLAAGEPVPEEGDFFGVSVVMASRLTDIAAGGQVVCSVEVVELAKQGPLTFSSLGRRAIKGMPGDHEIFEVTLPP